MRLNLLLLGTKTCSTELLRFKIAFFLCLCLLPYFMLASCLSLFYLSFLTLFHLIQSKSKTQITRSVHCKLNCITVKYNGTRHSIYNMRSPLSFFCFYFIVSLNIPSCIPLQPICLSQKISFFFHSLSQYFSVCPSLSFPPSLHTIFESFLSFCFVCLSLFQCLFLINLLAWFFLSHLCLYFFLFFLVFLFKFVPLCFSFPLFCLFVFLSFSIRLRMWKRRRRDSLTPNFYQKRQKTFFYHNEKQLCNTLTSHTVINRKPGMQITGTFDK